MLFRSVDGYLEAYEPTRAGRAISDFVNDNLSNWYVRLNRRRFWGGGMTEDKLSAYQTLYTCLETVAKLMAPIAPFYADQLFLDLVAVTGRENVESVHLSDSRFTTSLRSTRIWKSVCKWLKMFLLWYWLFAAR